LHHEKPPVQDIAATVTDGGREHVQPCRLFPVEIEKDGSVAEIVLDTFPNLFPDRLKQRVPRRNPL
jgi:hypothetical protein